MSTETKPYGMIYLHHKDDGNYLTSTNNSLIINSATHVPDNYLLLYISNYFDEKHQLKPEITQAIETMYKLYKNCVNQYFNIEGKGCCFINIKNNYKLYMYTHNNFTKCYDETDLKIIGKTTFNLDEIKGQIIANGPIIIIYKGCNDIDEDETLNLYFKFDSIPFHIGYRYINSASFYIMDIKGIKTKSLQVRKLTATK